MELWPHQQRTLDAFWPAVDAGEKEITITGPTGCGKTVIACELIREAVRRSMRVAVYTNRKALRNQISKVFDGQDIEHGVRAAGESPSHWKRVQVCAVDTDYSRVIKRGLWDVHDAQLVIIDERHANKAGKMQALLKEHEGAVKLGLTATPIGLPAGGRLIVAGTNSELRQCGAHVPAYHYDMGCPDMSGFRTSVKTGEYTEGDVVKAIMTPQLFGRVRLHHHTLNPSYYPALGFAPGVKESMWFVDQYVKEGVPAGHIDGKNIYYGERDLVGEPVLHATDDDRRAELFGKLESGEIKIIWNRFVMREGIDLPYLYHCIFATAFGSLQSYLQAGGRVVRNHESIDKVIIQDHGGNYHRHGSLNEDRVWELGWGHREASQKSHKVEPEEKTITCPECKTMRLRGSVCPACGYETKTKGRYVVETDGQLKLMPWENPKPKLHRSEEQKAWDSAYWRCFNANGNRTFKQASFLYKQKMGHWPPKNLKNMPVSDSDWQKSVKEVPKKALIE